jgi:ATP-dependent phosphoenolpyruvate carboxykinase
LHVGQTWCACFGEPQFSQVETRGASIPCWARRLSRRDFDVFLFGTAMSDGPW